MNISRERFCIWKGMDIKMRYIVDRMIENSVLCENENKEIIELPKSKLPLDIKEGDIIIKQEDSFRIDYEATQERKQKIKIKLKKLFKQ